MLRLLGQARAFQGQRDLRGEGREQMHLFRQQDPARIGGQQRQHAAHIVPGVRTDPVIRFVPDVGGAACHQWQIDGVVAGQRVGAEPGAAPLDEHQLRHPEVGGAQRTMHARTRRVSDLAFHIRQQHHHLGVEYLAGMAHGAGGDVVDTAGGRQFACHRVEQGGAALAVAGDARLQAYAGRQVADDERHHQHDRESHQVLGVGDSERKTRRDEKEIEGGDIDHRDHDRRSVTVARGDQHRAQHVDHDQVGQFERRRHPPRQPGAGKRGRQAPQVARPADLGRCRRHAQEGAAFRQHRIVFRGTGADHINVDVAPGFQQHPGGGRAPQPGAAPVRPADQHARDIAGARIVQDRLRGGDAVQRERFGPQRFGQAQQFDAPVARLLGQAQQLRGFDIYHQPLRMQGLGHALAGAHQAFGLGVRTDGHQQAFTGGPGRADGVIRAVLVHLGIHPVGGGAQRHFAQRDQVALAEKVVDRLARALGYIDPPFLEPLQQILGRNVDQLDLVGTVEHMVGHGLLHARTGDLRHHVAEAFEVLDVDRGVDIDAGLEQFLHVLPAFGVAFTGQVGMGEFVDQQQGRRPLECRIEIEFVQARPAMLHLPQRQHLQTLQQGFGFRAPVRFDIAGHHVNALGLALAGRLKHRVSLADAGGGTEKNLQPAAPLARLGRLDTCQQRVGVGALVGAGSGLRAWHGIGLREDIRLLYSIRRRRFDIDRHGAQCMAAEPVAHHHDFAFVLLADGDADAQQTVSDAAGCAHHVAGIARQPLVTAGFICRNGARPERRIDHSIRREMRRQQGSRDRCRRGERGLQPGAAHTVIGCRRVQDWPPAR